MKDKRNTADKKGVALLVVLFIVMTITILSLGFLSRSDVELACGKNMILRTQMDYLAESGLEHARGLILNPQDVNSEYWAGKMRRQLVVGSDDYYDVNVVKLSECNYQITCDAYREKMGEKTGRSSLEAELRFDPCIAYWAGAGTTIGQQITINGDVYCNGNVSGNGYIMGDVFASGSITGVSTQGQRNEAVAETPIDWPGIAISDFSSNYYIDTTIHSPQVVDSNVHPAGNFNPSASNPAGVRYCTGDIELPGGVNISGMLVVNGNLKISAGNNVINSVKNFPALLVGGQVTVEDSGMLEVNGLTQIGQGIVISEGAGNINIDIVGGLFIANGGIEGTISETVSINITAAPAITSIQTWPEAGIAKRWSPAGGALFRSIARK